MSNQLISLLYDAVLRNDVCSNAVTEAEIISAIKAMTEVYKPRLNSLSSTDKYLADYNTVAHRCAYLHKYAAFHTAIVRDVLVTVLNQDMDFFRSLYHKLTTSMLKICSLGGGPGSDIIGIVAALSQIASFKCSAKVVDLKADWEHTLWSVMHELRCRDYGLVGECFQVENFRWEYLMADLLENEVDHDVTEAIGDADWVTMVKFVSAASCKSTETMLMKIFTMLKSGSMVLFIDNASGGFSELVSTVSKKCNMRYVFGPINHKTYTNEDLKRNLCGYNSCFSTTLTIHLIEKQGRNRESNFTVDQAEWVRETHSMVDQTRWTTDSDFIIDQSGWISQSRPITQSRWLRESNPIETQVGWNLDSDYTVDQSRWLREIPLIPKSRWMKEPNLIEVQAGWNSYSDYKVDPSGWISETPLIPQSRWIKESNPIEPQAEWNTDFTIDQSVWISESRPIAQIGSDRVSQPLSVWGREPQPLSVWDREPQPLSLWDRELQPLPVWDRELQPHLLPLPLWDTEPKPLLPLPVWGRQSKPLLPLPVWGRQSNFPVNESEWVRDSNPIIAQSRFNSGKILHCNSIKMRQQNKFKRGRSLNIGRKIKFHNTSTQMKKQFESHMRL